MTNATAVLANMEKKNEAGKTFVAYHWMKTRDVIQTESRYSVQQTTSRQMTSNPVSVSGTAKYPQTRYASRKKQRSRMQ